MPATHRKASDGTSRLIDSLNARAAAGSRPVDNFSSIQTYYRRADLLLRQVGGEEDSTETSPSCCPRAVAARVPVAT